MELGKKTLWVFPNHYLTRENRDVNIDYYIPILGTKKGNDLLSEL